MEDKHAEKSPEIHLDEILKKSLSEISEYVTDISKLSDKVGENVFVRGWVYRQRRTGNLSFVVVRDGTGIVQCALNKTEVSDKEWNESIDVYIESVVELVGTVVEDARAPGGVEVHVKEFHLAFKGESFPISKDQSTEFLLDVRHLWVRSQTIKDVLMFKAMLIETCRDFLNKKGFIEIQTPLLTSSAAEGGATVFSVDYFGRKAYLAQTGQLYSEALISAYPLVYNYAPSFRAEPSRTPRHLTEFWQMEPEMAFYDQEMNMKLQEELVVHFAHELAKRAPDILKKFNRDPEDLLKIRAPFERLTYGKAIEELAGKGLDIKWGDGIGLDEEKILVSDRTQPIFLTNQPKEMRAFYMKINPDDPRTVMDADVLAPEGIGEIIGGSERVSDYDELMQRLREQKLKPEDYKWYTDLRKYGSVPHSGFGMGSERVVRWLLKLESIRDAIPFPRTINRLEP